ncbi:response regulator [Pedobacter sp. WC2423]|uniref:response regulator n=1 Tax=Pedobacter sp. WC2423 TaxID=3234142 RepID=UPI003467256A
MKISIGIIDDHKLFLMSLVLMLDTFKKYEVIIQASNGQDLKDKMRLSLNHPEIMLIDVNMPVMDGLETTAWLSQNYPEIKLVALSMTDTDSTVIEMIKAGCCAYLLKDTHPNELEKALNEIYIKGQYNADVSNINFRRLLNHKPNVPLLNEKEKVFLKLACSDLTYKQIASLMFLSERTIDGYREKLFEKLNVQSRVGMVLEAIRKNIVKL